MAQAALAGHFSTFYWGQPYGGAEPYLAAPIVWATHGSPFAPRRHGRAPVGRGGRAGRRGRGRGHRTAVRRRRGGDAGLGLALRGGVELAARDRVPGRQRGLRPGDGATPPCASGAAATGGATGSSLGLAAGVGWWSSPEIVYFAVPDRRRARGLLGAALRRRAAVGGPVAARPGPGRRWRRRWWARSRGSTPTSATSFASLRTGVPPHLRRGSATPGGCRSSSGRCCRSSSGCAPSPAGQWVGGAGGRRPSSTASLLAVVAASVVRAAVAARHGRRAAPALAAAAGVVAFPFLYAAVPSSGYWLDGRYGVALPVLVVLLVATAWVGRPAERRRERPRAPRAAHASPRRRARDGPGSAWPARRWWPGRG